MAERGVGVRQLARAVYVNAGHVSNLRNRKAMPSPKLAAAIDAYLDAGGALAALVPGSGRTGAAARTAGEAPPVAHAISEVAHADLIGSSVGTSADRTRESISAWDDVPEPAGPSVLTRDQASPREISHLEETARLFRAWDHEHGGGTGRKAALGQLSEVAALLDRPHPAPLRKRLFGVASMLGLTIASMSADSGDAAAAYRYLGIALDTAKEARDCGLGARAANAIARRLLDDGDPCAALGIVRHAHASLRGLDAEMKSMLTTTEAWTCAVLGDYEQMAPCLDRAAGQAGEPGSLFGAAELAGISGACFEVLVARSRPPLRAGYAARAEQHIAEALRLRQAFYARSRVLDLAGLANVRLCQDEPAEAMRTAALAMESAAGLRSGRAARRVHAVAVKALGQYPAIPEVTDFAELVRARLPVT
jgi:hypothetical protein